MRLKETICRQKHNCEKQFKLNCFSKRFACKWVSAPLPPKIQSWFGIRAFWNQIFLLHPVAASSTLDMGGRGRRQTERRQSKFPEDWLTQCHLESCYFFYILFPSTACAKGFLGGMVGGGGAPFAAQHIEKLICFVFWDCGFFLHIVSSNRCVLRCFWFQLTLWPWRLLAQDNKFCRRVFTALQRQFIWCGRWAKQKNKICRGRRTKPPI